MASYSWKIVLSSQIWIFIGLNANRTDVGLCLRRSPIVQVDRCLSRGVPPAEEIILRYRRTAIWKIRALSANFIVAKGLCVKFDCVMSLWHSKQRKPRVYAVLWFVTERRINETNTKRNVDSTRIINFNVPCFRNPSVADEIFRNKFMEYTITVSYTHLTLPTKRIV